MNDSIQVHVKKLSWGHNLHVVWEKAKQNSLTKTSIWGYVRKEIISQQSKLEEISAIFSQPLEITVSGELTFHHVLFCHLI